MFPAIAHERGAPRRAATIELRPCEGGQHGRAPPAFGLSGSGQGRPLKDGERGCLDSSAVRERGEYRRSLPGVIVAEPRLASSSGDTLLEIKVAQTPSSSQRHSARPAAVRCTATQPIVAVYGGDQLQRRAEAALVPWRTLHDAEF